MRTAIVLLLLSLGSASGQKSTEAEQAILDYQLMLPRANALLAAMVPMTKYVASLPPESLQKSAPTLAGQIAQMEKDEKAMAILKQNGLTARDYLVGSSALSAAYYIATVGQNPVFVASPANIAFVKANLAQLKPKMDAVTAAFRK